MPRASLVAVIGSIFFLVIGAASPATQAASAISSKPEPTVASGAELVAANPGGTSSVVLVINYESAAGRNLNARLAAFARNNPDVKVVVRPVGGSGPLAEFLAKAAYATARQGKFADFHESALKSPIANTWYSLRDNASLLGLDWPRFQQAYMDPAIVEDVRANMKFAEEQKISALPAFVAGGRAFTGTWEALNLTEIAAAAKAR